MLLMSRKKQESVVIGTPFETRFQVRVTVLEISGKQVKLGFEAEGDVPIQRWELWQRIHGAEANAAFVTGHAVSVERCPLGASNAIHRLGLELSPSSKEKTS